MAWSSSDNVTVNGTPSAVPRDDPKLERIPVLVVTAMENRRVAGDERIQGVMWKPFHGDQFVDLVARSARAGSTP